MISLAAGKVQTLSALLDEGCSYLLPGAFPHGSDIKESACNVGDPGLIPGSRRSPGEGNGHPLQYSSLGNSINRGAWQATIHVVARSQTRLSD